ALAILYPLEVADRDAASVSENIRDDENPLPLNDGIGVPRRRSVSTLAKDAAFHSFGILGRNLIFCRGGYKYFARIKQNVLRIGRLAATGKFRQRFLLPIDPVIDSRDIEASLVVEAPVDIADSS